jgi:hypothetical protein
MAVAAGFTLFALVRGLFTFSGNQTETTQSFQTKMMFSRVKWQAITVILIIIVSMVAST